MSDSLGKNRFWPAHHQDRMGFGNLWRLPVALCLALSLASGFAYADNNPLIDEANAALAKKDYSTAFPKFSVLAQRGNPAAQFNLGVFYLYGQGVQKDEKQAYEWFAKSAVQGNARALQVLQNSAARGNENAIAELNKLQQQPQQAKTTGQSQQIPSTAEKEATLLSEANAALDKKDYPAAFPKFQALAQQGNAIAQYNVGVFYLNGQGVQKDESLANDWFAKSAAQGNKQAKQAMQSMAAKAKADADATAKAQAKARTEAETKARAEARANAEAKARKDAKAGSTATAQRKESGRPSKSALSDFSFGASLGQTGKLKGIKSSLSFGLLAGYKFNADWGVEVAYSALYRNANADEYISTIYPATTATFGLNSLSAAAQYTYGLGNNLSLIGNLGAHTSSFKINSTGSGSRTGNSSGLLLGAKAQYDLNRNFGLRGGIDVYTQSGGLTGTLTQYGVTAISRF